MINVSGGPWVLRQADVPGFAVPEDSRRYESQLLLDNLSSGSADLQVYRFTLYAGQLMHGEVHEANDECYYGLSGIGEVVLKESEEAFESRHEVGPGTLVFMPAGTHHRLENHSEEPLVVLSIWPRAPAASGNKIAEARRAAWGKTLMLKPTTTEHHV